MSGQETYSTDGPKCPYCGRQYPCDEPHYYDESGYTSDECDECGNTFSVSVYTSTSWTCEAVEPDCREEPHHTDNASASPSEEVKL